MTRSIRDTYQALLGSLQRWHDYQQREEERETAEEARALANAFEAFVAEGGDPAPNGRPPRRVTDERREVVREIVAQLGRTPSFRELADLLAARGFLVSHRAAGDDLAALGFSGAGREPLLLTVSEWIGSPASEQDRPIFVPAIDRTETLAFVTDLPLNDALRLLARASDEFRAVYPRMGLRFSLLSVQELPPDTDFEILEALDVEVLDAAWIETRITGQQEGVR